MGERHRHFRIPRGRVRSVEGKACDRSASRSAVYAFLARHGRGVFLLRGPDGFMKSVQGQQLPITGQER
ncbi:hypothetical protein NDU88_000633 [Pleurodeles waltl]|uniref:Uncharacterized protein n=1 Tax=Pleurodeles waltl TaxID=8319 RepID=A0AAV7SX87_PLEWA|nr:hypothetical protein NDU88_000633 [Pleurodeles waltl]